MLLWFRDQSLAVLTVCLGLLVGATPLSVVHAAERDPQVAPAASAAPPPGQEDPPVPPKVEESVIVTAARGTTDLETSPVSVTVVTKADIEKRAVVAVDQALATVEGAATWRQRGIADTEASVGMRGFSGRPSGQNRILVVVDGQPLNNSSTGSVNWNAIPIGEVDRVEVVRGPFSSLYGGNAMGGVINIITRPVDRRSFDLLGRYGTYDTRNYSGRFSDRFFGRLGVSVAYEGLVSDGYRNQEATQTATLSTASGGTLVTGIVPTLTRAGAATNIIGLRGNGLWDRQSLRARLEYAFSSQTFASLQHIGQRSRLENGAYQSFARDGANQALDAGPVVFRDGDVFRRIVLAPTAFLGTTIRSATELTQGQVTHAVNARHLLRFQAGYVNAPPRANGNDAASAGATLAGGPGTVTQQLSRGIFGNAQWSGTVGNAHQLTAGVDLRTDQSETTTLPTTNYLGDGVLSARTTYAAARARTLAVYVQDAITVSERFSVTAGVRGDAWHTYDGRSQKSAPEPTLPFDDRRASAFTGKVAAAFRLADRTNLRASVGTAFRTPSIFELYRDTRNSTGTLLLGNPDLDPEFATSWEVGVRQGSAKVSADVTYYENRIRDLVFRSTDVVFDPTGGTSRFLNAGQSRARGVEIGVDVRPASWLMVRPIYTLTDSVITKNDNAPGSVGKEYPFLSRHIGGGTASIFTSRWTATVTARLQSAMFATDTNTDTTKGVPGSYEAVGEADAFVAFRPVRGVSVEFACDNVFNGDAYLFYRNPGRTFTAGVRLRR
jgi:iron complex outermembrane receptor protein